MLFNEAVAHLRDLFKIIRSASVLSESSLELGMPGKKCPLLIREGTAQKNFELDWGFSTGKQAGGLSLRVNSETKDGAVFRPLISRKLQAARGGFSFPSQRSRLPRSREASHAAPSPSWGLCRDRQCIYFTRCLCSRPQATS